MIATENRKAGCAGNFRAFLSGAKHPLDNTAWSGFLAAFSSAFPDSHISFDSCVARPPLLPLDFDRHSTGAIPGHSPSGRPIQFTGIEFNRVANGSFASTLADVDNIALLRQIGAMPE